MATRFDRMVQQPQTARMARADAGDTRFNKQVREDVSGEPAEPESESGNFREGSPEAAMERLNARRKTEGRPDAAELHARKQEQTVEAAADISRRLDGDIKPEPLADPDDDDPVIDDIDDDPELDAGDADDVDNEDDLLDDADPGDDEDDDSREVPRGWRDDSEGAELFATLDPAIQDEIVRRADAADTEYDRRFGELRQTEENVATQARSTQSVFEGASRYLQTVLQEDIPQEPSIELLNPQSEQYDPEMHARLLHQHKAQVHVYNQRVQGLQQLHADSQKAAEERRAIAMADSEKKLFQAFPEWLKDDGKVGQRELGGIKEFIVGRGVDPVVVENLHDATLIMLARDAMLWRDHAKAQKRARKTVPKRVKKVQRAGRGRRSGASRGDAANVAALHERFKASGSLEDGVAYRKARKASQT